MHSLGDGVLKNMQSRVGPEGCIALTLTSLLLLYLLLWYECVWLSGYAQRSPPPLRDLIHTAHNCFLLFVSLSYSARVSHGG